jgi:small subunit ribosomal protein S1
MSDDVKMQGEMAAEAAPSTSMQDLLEADLGLKQIKRGDVLTGTIIRISPTEILVDVATKYEGVIAGEELEKVPADVLTELKVGDAITTYVVNPQDRNGNVVLALTRTQASRDWAEAEELNAKQDVFEGLVAGYNKGGLIVKVGKIRGFVPASQLVSLPRGEEGSDPNKRLAALVGQKLHLKVIELDRDQNRLILSERAAQRQWRKLQKEKMLSELREGDVREGEVISIADFGAFVDLGGADGLVHLSEVSWKPIMHPSEAVKVGQTVKVQVLKVDPEHKRVGLSIKRLEQDPWATIETRYKVGQLVEGEITKMAKFGAFARIIGDDAIEGLIHVSELSDRRVNHPKEVVKEGQLVTLRVIRIDAAKRRLGLSLKKVAQSEYADEDWRQALDAVNESEAPQSEAPQSEAPQSEAPQSEVLQSEVPQSEVPQSEAAAPTVQPGEA